ncbi:FadR family transcriptional regulator [Anaerovorax odorimutans]|uniref:FadR family transcriptional regulator n=1 Tax=Anaerovorax odorimutans TaxID=109327 RepID=A0ABT1RSN3_9FIRM|nr:FadR/GntR family transcriptional regulator [Anaerovorax odorimutans]MCQ4638154.1 FadR family transcriptional regulator [Anaerovorax odorimutans]
MKPVKYSFTKQIADEIEEKIRCGEYKVGDRIPPEPELIQAFGVSRNTVRESVQALIHAGILEARQGDGTYVVAKDRLQVDFYGLMGKTEREEVREVRNLLEEYIVSSAALNAEEKDLTYMEKCLLQRNAAVNTVREHTEADVAFHLAIALATHNSLLIHLYKYVSQYFNEFIAENLAAHKDNQEYIDELHSRLFYAIRDKESRTAKEIVSEIINL